MNKFFLKIIFVFFFLSSLVGAETLQKIDISGNKRISDQTIIIFSEIEINEEITKSKLDEVIKRLYQTNFFKVSAFAKDSKKKKIVIIFINKLFMNISFIYLKHLILNEHNPLNYIFV